MSTTPPMKIPRRAASPPGFARRHEPDEPATAARALAPDIPTLPAIRAPEVTLPATAPTGESLAAMPPSEPTAARRPARSDQAGAPEVMPPDAEAEDMNDAASVYEDAATRAFNMRMLEPLHRRYAALVRRCADEGFETSMTELTHALLHNGPGDTAEARELVRAWRRVRAVS